MIDFPYYVYFHSNCKTSFPGCVYFYSNRKTTASSSGLSECAGCAMVCKMGPPILKLPTLRRLPFLVYALSKIYGELLFIIEFIT